ncbi:Ketosteroid isomerase-related protein [Lentzea xinjiangensis]|uniref:Ketosteroid isomerase-related protein n=1 Tax=Lentzea xinjiangensis TaxID=402600 RepID=A0A1H9WMK6_9PSEU|nr:nuclear transport factor 2 family protein [Lentzea xinjiangensis]SES34999.1 Ketosteroid isomerase-related protein [Lentzea xinjiangensis]
MPAQTSVEKVRSYYTCVDKGDVPGLLALFAPDAVYHRPGYPPMNGRTELSRFYRGDRVIETGGHTLNSVTADDGGVAVQGTFAGVLKDGCEVSLRFADFFAFTDDGLFARRDTFFFSPMV